MTSPIPPQNVYDSVERLVKKFKALSTRERNAYNEDNTRKDFILPMFRAFGWSIDDAREVAAEEKMSRGYVDFAFRINFDDKQEKKQHDAIVALVEEMLELQKEYAEADRKLFAEKSETLKRKIDALDAKIDQAVYRLYGLSEEEIKVVEEK